MGSLPVFRMVVGSPLSPRPPFCYSSAPMPRGLVGIVTFFRERRHPGQRVQVALGPVSRRLIAAALFFSVDFAYAAELTPACQPWQWREPGCFHAWKDFWGAILGAALGSGFAILAALIGVIALYYVTKKQIHDAHERDEAARRRTQVALLDVMLADAADLSISLRDARDTMNRMHEKLCSVRKSRQTNRAIARYCSTRWAHWMISS